LSPLPGGATFDAAAARFQWTPDFGKAGDYTVRFGVQDGGGLSDTTDVKVHIAKVNRPPVLDVSDHTALVGHPLHFVLKGSDPDAGETLTYSATGLPGAAAADPFRATLNPRTGEFDWTPGPAAAGDYVVTFSVSDGEAVTSKAVLLRATT